VSNQWCTTFFANESIELNIPGNIWYGSLQLFLIQKHRGHASGMASAARFLPDIWIGFVIVSPSF
jgi:hypothetical protein